MFGRKRREERSIVQSPSEGVTTEGPKRRTTEYYSEPEPTPTTPATDGPNVLDAARTWLGTLTADSDALERRLSEAEAIATSRAANKYHFDLPTLRHETAQARATVQAWKAFVEGLEAELAALQAAREAENGPRWALLTDQWTAQHEIAVRCGQFWANLARRQASAFEEEARYADPSQAYALRTRANFETHIANTIDTFLLMLRWNMSHEDTGRWVLIGDHWTKQ